MEGELSPEGVNAGLPPGPGLPGRVEVSIQHGDPGLGDVDELGLVEERRDARKLLASGQARMARW